MTDLDLVKIQLGLECIGIKDDGLIGRIDGPDPDDIGMVYYFQTEDGQTLSLYRQDLDTAVLQKLMQLELENAVNNPGSLVQLVGGEGSTRFVEYVFEEAHVYNNADIFVKHNRKLRVEYQDGDVVMGFCESTRENDYAAEAWIFVEPPYRRKGLAKLLANAWAHEVKKRGKIAFYSHLADNAQSRALAESLELRKFVEAFTV